MREKLNIFQIPALIIIEGQAFLDGIDISREEYYRQLPRYNALPTTSSPSSGEFQALYRKVFSLGFTEILSIHLAAELSGLINVARLAAEEMGSNIHVFDSGQVTLGLGFQVLEAARAATQDVPVNEIIIMLQALQEKIYVFAMLDTLVYILKSGRIPWVKASLGAFLNLKPLIQLKKGEVINVGLSRARKRAISRLHQTIQELGPLEHLAVLHTNAEKDGEEFLACYQDSLPHRSFLVNVTTSIGTHVGPNGLGFAAVVK
jgi:DegV family protein with EDD domain